MISILAIIFIQFGNIWADPDREITLNCDGEAELFRGLPDLVTGGDISFYTLIKL